jgi:hypothetical protein
MSRFLGLTCLILLPVLVSAVPAAAVLAAISSLPPGSATMDEQALRHNEDEAYRPARCSRGGLIPVCYRVPTTRKKLHVEYQIKCEPVCVPGCGRLAHCRDECSCGDVHIRQKKTLLKKVTETDVQSYEYKIKWVCRACAFGGGCGGSLAPQSASP